MSGVEEALAAHLPQGGLGWTRDQDGCSCGTVLPTYAEYRAHVAEQLQPLIRQAQAEALRAVAAGLPALTEGPLRVGTALWPECDRDAYSLAVEEAQHALHDRADRLAGDAPG